MVTVKVVGGEGSIFKPIVERHEKRINMFALYVNVFK